MASRRSPRQRRSGRPAPAGPRALLYKVVELSAVDEASLERTLNEWVPKGWRFDGVQFAMRESSRRPSMAFVFFTREGAPLHEEGEAPRFRDEADARRHLARVAEGGSERRGDAWARLRALAGEGDEA